jgi:hypothetical protein
MVPGGRVLYMSPNGSDSAAGSASAPWRTLAGAVGKLKPGDTLYVRGGTYANQTLNWQVSGTASAPIWVKAYPGETPVFDGSSTRLFIWFRDGASHVYLDGLKVVGYGPSGTGVIIFTDGAHHIVLTGMTMSNFRMGGYNDHIIYPAAAGVNNITVKYSYLAGASGGAVHLYHAPGAQQVRVQNNTIRDSYWGVIADSGSSVEVSYNTFVNNTTNIRRTGGATVTAFGNSPNDTIN